VTFDDDRSQSMFFFSDVLETHKNDILSDQAPAPDHVKLHDWVCARRSADQVNYFWEFIVKIVASVYLLPLYRTN